MSSTIDSALLHSARSDAEAAASRAGVDVRLLEQPSQCEAASRLLGDVWGSDDPDAGPSAIAEPGLLVALEHAGNYVGGAYPRRLVVTEGNADEIQGMAFGFFGQPIGRVMHSHVAGVRRNRLGAGVGTALKLDQRAWCLEQGLSEMTWTFDPLVARNAYFNFQRLGADCAEYLSDFYGVMTDGVNAGQASDRMLVSWQLDRPVGRSAVEFDVDSASFAWVLTADPATEEPVAAGGSAHGGAAGGDAHGALGSAPAAANGATTVGVQIPLDIERLRVDDPELAGRWRMALREALTGLLSDGWQITGVGREGVYVLQR